MNRTTLHIIFIILFIISTGCSFSEQKHLSEELKEICSQNESTYVFVGMEWCAASEQNFVNIFVPFAYNNPDKSACAVFFASKDYYTEMLSKSQFAGQTFVIDSKGGIIDKCSSYYILKQIISDYKWQDNVPIMIKISADTYQIWPFE